MIFAEIIRLHAASCREKLNLTAAKYSRKSLREFQVIFPRCMMQWRVKSYRCIMQRGVISHPSSKKIIWEGSLSP
jgi:hypothetical protein